jgi:hypothetical protein
LTNINYLQLQENGSAVFGDSFILTKAQKLSLDIITNNEKNDGNFVGDLLMMVYGEELHNSSITGRSRLKNVNLKKLDETKLAWIKGKIF